MVDEINWFEWNDTTKSLAVAVGIMAFIWLPNLFFSFWEPSVTEKDRKRLKQREAFKNK